MKYILSLIIIISLGGVKAENAGIQTKLLFNSTFSEGFGILIKKDFVIRKVNPNPGAKGSDSEEIYIVMKTGEQETLLLVNVATEIREKIEQSLREKKQLKITGIGYESLRVSGGPAISRSVREENIDELEPPGSPGWGVKKVFELMWFRLR